jgi:hypothetical protein
VAIEEQYARVRADLAADGEPPTLFLHDLHVQASIAKFVGSKGLPAAARRELRRLVGEGASAQEEA